VSIVRTALVKRSAFLSRSDRATLRAQGQPQSEWLAALSADQTLPPKANRGGSIDALQFAGDWKP